MCVHPLFSISLPSACPSIAAAQSLAEKSGSSGAEAALSGLSADLGQQVRLDAATYESFIQESASGMPAIAAITGGVAANHILKAISRKGEPLDNFFLFSIANGAGEVSRFGKA